MVIPKTCRDVDVSSLNDIPINDLREINDMLKIVVNGVLKEVDPQLTQYIKNLLTALKIICGN